MEIGRKLPPTPILNRIPAFYRTTGLEQRIPLLRSFETYVQYLVDYHCIFGRAGGYQARIGSFEFINDTEKTKLVLGIKFEVTGTPPGDKEAMTRVMDIAIENVEERLKEDFPVLRLQTMFTENEHPLFDTFLRINLDFLSQT